MFTRRLRTLTILLLILAPAPSLGVEIVEAEPTNTLRAEPSALGFPLGQPASISISGGIGTYSIQSHPNPAIATVSIENNTVHVTGVADGESSVTVIDSATPPGSVTVEFNVFRSTPPWGFETPATLSGATTGASIALGVSNDGGTTQSLSGAFLSSDTIYVTASIAVDPRHVGHSGTLIAVARWNDHWFMRDGDSWRLWDGSVSNLTAVATPRPLTASEPFEIATALSGLPGEFVVFAGYQIEDEVIYNATPAVFTVQ